MTGLALRPLPGWLRRIAGCVEQDPPTPVCDGASLSSGHRRLSSGGDRGVLGIGDGPIQAGSARQAGRFLRCSHVTKPTRPRSRGQINAHPMLDSAIVCAYIRTMKNSDTETADTIVHNYASYLYPLPGAQGRVWGERVEKDGRVWVRRLDGKIEIYAVDVDGLETFLGFGVAQ